MEVVLWCKAHNQTVTLHLLIPLLSVTYILVINHSSSDRGTDPRADPHYSKLSYIGGKRSLSTLETRHQSSVWSQLDCCLLISLRGDWTFELQNNLSNCIENGSGLENEAWSHFSEGESTGYSRSSVLSSLLVEVMLCCCRQTSFQTFPTSSKLP